MPQHDLQARLISAEQQIEAALGPAIKAAVLMALGFEQVGAHHRRERPGDHQGKDQRDTHGDCKFAEQQADIAAHQEKRNEDGD